MLLYGTSSIFREYFIRIPTGTHLYTHYNMVKPKTGSCNFSALEGHKNYLPQFIHIILPFRNISSLTQQLNEGIEDIHLQH